MCKFQLTHLLSHSYNRYQTPSNASPHKNSFSDTSQSTDQFSFKESSQSSKTKLHQWVYNLKNFDTRICEYSSQNLVIIREKNNSLSQLSWDKLVMLPFMKIHSCINEVIIIPRSSHGQFYIVQGLRTSLHFSLGPSGTKAFRDHCTKSKIHICTVSGIESLNNNRLSHIPLGIYVKTVDKLSISRTEHCYKQLMTEMSAHLWEELFKVCFLPIVSKMLWINLIYSLFLSEQGIR